MPTIRPVERFVDGTKFAQLTLDRHRHLGLRKVVALADVEHVVGAVRRTDVVTIGAHTDFDFVVCEACCDSFSGGCCEANSKEKGAEDKIASHWNELQKDLKGK